jgi:acetyl-CoA C-acetyltransferase
MTQMHTPIIAGVAQLVERESDPRIAMTPLQMLTRIAQKASIDTGLGERLLREIDTIGIVDIPGWSPRNAPTLLGEQLGVKPSSTLCTVAGGDIPLVLVNFVAKRIEDGRTRVALIAGANNFKTLQRAMKEKVSLEWEQGGAGEPQVIGTQMPHYCEWEKQHGLLHPIHYYPIFENALRARRGRDLESHRVQMGMLMHRFTRVAAKNPYAWFPVERGVDELTIPTAANRMICFPYTKYLNAVLDTNQSAGVLMMSAQAARDLGIPEEKQIYWWGGTSTQEDPWFVSERPNLADSPSLHRCAEETFVRTGTSIRDMDFMDFYSCFPVAVELAAEAFGVDENDPRGLTVTGGLPYAGGPGSNYTLHSLSTMVSRLRAHYGATGLVTGNGMFLSSHSTVVISTEPRDPSRGDASATSSKGNKDAIPTIAEEASGRCRIEAYTVIHDRSGAPELGIVIGRLHDERRFVANTPSDRTLLEDFTAVEGVGRKGRVRHIDGRNVFEPN